MPDSRSDDAGEDHGKHEFPGKSHDLIYPHPGQSSANPDENEKQCGQLREEPDIRWNESKPSHRCIPATEEECHRQTADGEHSEVFRQEKCGVLESGILRHVSGDNL